ncbi:MAG TPA: beta-galactosidase GalB [Bacteroidota bacterium]|nr:beta-galactosidase GalB [Bacteroidota bacterium]
MHRLFFFKRSILFCFGIFVSIFTFAYAQRDVPRTRENFGKNWQFHLGDVLNGQRLDYDDSQWRVLHVPHDWSIEGEFSNDNPATAGGGALPGGIGWYRKSFTIPETEKNRLVFIDFDGVYRNSEVWLNGQYLGKRPYGYSSFRYELTPYLHYGNTKNILAVKVDNSQQPNSRWYSGSGIYRNVWLVKTNNIFVDHWGTFITAPAVNERSATISITTTIKNKSGEHAAITLRTSILDAQNISVAHADIKKILSVDSLSTLQQELIIQNPLLWSVENPYLYKAITTIEENGIMIDQTETPFGIRTFAFDSAKGFSLNGKHMKILGVCDHHDLGCLGAAVNYRALQRQLEILKAMGVNGIRTSHNPPAPELLDLCDQMGFVVLDEAFDMWKHGKTKYDYSLNWNEWHQRDIQDMVQRDRNHPSVVMWSIGNELMEQWDKNDSGIIIAKELRSLVRQLDTTRPITSACSDPVPSNPVIKSGALDLIGFNYHQNDFSQFPKIYPAKCFLGTETTSALATRGHYDMPADSIRRWPIYWDSVFTTGNKDFTCSSYDNCSAPWGSTHEETWKIVKKYDFLSGMFIWTGFDYLGEPTPYDWPARSSYFGIIDLAGFPKDVYYMYQSEWTSQPILHLFPHWNWKQGDTVDVWAYTNCSSVELFLNGLSLGKKEKIGDDLHLQWRVPFFPGTLKAIGTTADNKILTQEIQTAGAPAKIILEADRTVITADGKDLSFVTVKVVDQQGTLVPYADNLIHFSVDGQGAIAGVDNGCETSHEPFHANFRKAFNGMCLVVIQSTEQADRILLHASSDGLPDATITLQSK